LAEQEERTQEERKNAKCKEICNGKEFQLLPICAFGIQLNKRGKKARRRREEETLEGDQTKTEQK
jgi:hypothetical protein